MSTINCKCPKKSIPSNSLGINFGGSENRPGNLMTVPFRYAINIRSALGRTGSSKITYANKELNAFGRWAGVPGGSGAPPRNYFG